ncbi:hypothetical protein GCM10009557_02280 [Virgisporangium ochraceum]|uniref:Uncharacterized protein n=1 Tax=Virgisporangium ochraceum TaxID=65505 RepID=A0A8J4A1G7_9ACTN|nr:hypothetical protein [Virgisporangium ochraceum]GIJ72847.1 hypothetical protein Voc01_077640 [Virgisporangium ochraceum]
MMIADGQRLRSEYAFVAADPVTGLPNTVLSAYTDGEEQTIHCSQQLWNLAAAVLTKIGT